MMEKYLAWFKNPGSRFDTLQNIWLIFRQNLLPNMGQNCLSSHICAHSGLEIYYRQEQEIKECQTDCEPCRKLASQTTTNVSGQNVQTVELIGIVQKWDPDTGEVEFSGNKQLYGIHKDTQPLHWQQV